MTGDHHRASDKLFAGILFIFLYRKALLNFGADIDEYILVGDADMPIDLLSLVIQVKGKGENEVVKTLPFRCGD
ncbi:MAG: hypothetical protein LUG23_03715 [Oscillospiraceae bacterium]|nr:hypothetical protein [Oscillospiraceae bacterium]